jgi:acetyl-CoA carboxylase/biotin carboxylase 1
MKLREKMIFGVYQQVAVHFADLHDTPGRMKSKGVIKKQVDWAASRTFFYWRLRRRLFEFSIAKTISNMSNTGKVGYRQEFIKELQSFYVTKGGDLKQWDDDKIVVGWLQANEKSVLAFLNQKKQVALSSALSDKLIEISKLGPDSLSVLKHALASIPDDVKESLVDALK